MRFCAFTVILVSVKKTLVYTVAKRMFDIHHNFQLSMNFSTYMMKSTRAKIIQVIKFRFHSLRNKMIHLVLVIKYQPLNFRQV